MVLKRLTVTAINILFPPLAVYLMCGPGHDLFINSMLFLLAIIPSHVHCFYLSWTYFNRKRKARKGVYPGGPRPMIYSNKVQNGGASRREIRRMKRTSVWEKSPKRPGITRRIISKPKRIALRVRQLRHRSEPEWTYGYDAAVTDKSTEVGTADMMDRRTSRWIEEQRRYTS